MIMQFHISQEIEHANLMNLTWQKRMLMKYVDIHQM